MKFKLKETNTSSIPWLVEAIKNIWEYGIDMDYYRKHANSMPQYKQAVLKACGGYTKY